MVLSYPLAASSMAECSPSLSLHGPRDGKLTGLWSSIDGWHGSPYGMCLGPLSLFSLKVVFLLFQPKTQQLSWQLITWVTSLSSPMNFWEGTSPLCQT